MINIILASQSVDRKRILTRSRIPFTTVESGVNENFYKRKITDPIELVQVLAKEKVIDVKKRVKENKKNSFFIGADTIVEFEGEIIGKAIDEKDAFKILKKLSGKTHNLITGVAVSQKEDKKVFTDYDITKVSFLSISDDEIWDYIRTEEWKGRAGAYSIKDRASLFIKSINGSPSNVIGLPLQKIFQIFKLKYQYNFLKYI
ncbi:MAG: septum formation protein Maf [Promethearchaeota archaeon]|nr:MAG: septum formation protein Maf [Candidatus Lokiarchaeota archaeon]